MKQIGIYGSSGFAREVAWLAESCVNTHPPYRIVCFIDDDPSRHGNHLNGIPIMGLEQALHCHPGLSLVAGCEDPQVRERTMNNAAAAGCAFETLVHPLAVRSRWIEMGEGTVVFPGCTLTTNIRLGKQVHIRPGCTIGHDVIVGDHTTLAAGVHVCGWVHLGRRVYVGAGTVITCGTEAGPLHVGDDVVIRAGSCVEKSIESGEWGEIPPGRSASENAGSGEKREETTASADRFAGWRYPVIEEGKLTRYNWMVQHKDNLKLGYRTDIGAFTYINAKYGVTIEDHVQIGSHCSVYSVSTIDGKTGPVVLRKNCRIGSHCTIMPGVTIGEDAVVGAHSFVNRDVKKGTTVLGVPARPK